MKQILFTAQFPPPVNGASSNNEYIKRSDVINSRFKLHCINIATSKSIVKIDKWEFSKSILFFKTLFKILKKLLTISNLDLIIITLSPAGLGLIKDSMYISLFKIFKKKIIIFLHGRGIKSSYDNGIIKKTIINFIFKGSYVICLSKSLENDFNFLNFKKSFVLNCGIKVTASNDYSAIKKNDLFHIIFMSNLVKAKGIFDLLDAINLIEKNIKSKIKVDLICNEGDVTFQAVQNYIEKKGLNSIVEILGPKYGDEKHQILKRGNCFIMPSYYSMEGMPLAILEGLQYAMPIIACNNGAIADLVKNGYNGFLVKPQDPSEIAERITYLFKNPEIYKVISHNAYSFFIENFTLDKYESNFCNIVENVMLD